MKNIGFIGIGIMGGPMVKNLLKAGFNVSVFSRTKAKAEAVIEAGAVWCDTIAECAAKKDAVITIVGYPKDVEAVYFGEGGILSVCEDKSYIIDMTTTSPKLAKRIYEAAKAKGVQAVDAPVTGGDSGAKAGTLTILAGGDRTAFDACMPLFEAMGKNICYMGGAGSGQHTKMANQIAIAGAVAGACEAVAYAKAAGLDEKTVLGAISTGAAGSAQMSNVVSKAVSGDFQPGFFIKHFIKDMKLSDEEAADRDVKLQILEKVLSMYTELENKGEGELGTQALLKYYTDWGAKNGQNTKGNGKPQERL